MGSLTALRAARPLEDVAVRVSGPLVLTASAMGHLRELGATVCHDGPACGGLARFALNSSGLGKVTANAAWAGVLRDADAADEATVQAATGVMAVHGRRDGTPRGLAVDYAATCASVLTVAGLLAALVGHARGRGAGHVSTGADRAALLTVSQYLAAASAPEAETVPVAPGGPPFTAADGTRFELEALEPGVWAGFWRALGALPEAIRSGWPPFQFRYATACAPLPEALHAITRDVSWSRIQQAAAISGAEVCAVHRLDVGGADPGPPWRIEARTTQWAGTAAGPTPEPGGPLAGLTVLEAGRRIQAPLAAHLLRLLGADVVRIEPPGGDPLRGMPPCCLDVSARWLALNRHKRAVEIDIKSPAGQAELLELAAGADVFLHNWAPGKAEQLGLDNETLGALNPGLVYAYTSGWAGRLPDPPIGTDFMVQARMGIGEAVRSADEPTAPSLMTLIDVLGGLLGAEAILAGLLLRERTGTGVQVESSLLGAAETLTKAAGHQRRHAGFRKPLRTADGWIAPTDQSAAAAQAHAPQLAELPTDQALTALRESGLTATAVTTDLASLPADPRLRASLGHDAHGSLTVPSPWRFS
ncbi:CoA transferase [Streptomyces sp. RB6PN25]|uniref:CoA transferase n=1 Tax=Streptomyces humicola TaxID=2953240 RepID=A0ABT1PNL7_9ACTN|nr:CoA transferase [Streptomyces humicola]MCQ4079264.1 CoA transferase [Streptomyces humicola]